MSQRGFSAIIIVLLFGLVGAYAFANGFRPDFNQLLGADFLTTLTPLILVGTTLNTWFDVLDAKVLEGKLQPGNVGALFTMAEFYAAMVACLAGIVQVFGITPIDPETQTVLVNALLLAATLVFRSFSNRTPGDDVPTATKLAARETNNRRL